uniref:Zonadhesin-like n=1 Tax=Nicotiana tabacum TaxID=4097 RepID=A0A1S4BK79_TOBAC|nr:PREDICTED: zonadhesin-like [Nicotiana tabacum]
MTENQETSGVPSNTPIESPPVKTPMLNSLLNTTTNRNPRTESPPHSVPSPTQSSSSSHRNRKTSTPKRFVATSSPAASPEKLGEKGTVDEEENQEISSLPMEEGSNTDQTTGPENADSTKTVPILESTGYTSHSPAFSMELQEKKAIENILSIAAEGVIIEGGKVGSKPQGEDPKILVEGRELVPVKQSAQDNTTGVPNEEPYPSSEDTTQGSSQEPQVSIDPAPSPYFNVEPLSVVVPKMRSVSGEENGDSEEDFDYIAIASFIQARGRPVATLEPTPKLPTIRLQNKEALESALNKSQVSQRRRKLVKDGKAAHEKVVPVVTMDDEVDEEPGSLTHKCSQKHSLSKSKKKSSVSIESPHKSDEVISSENLVEESGNKIVEKGGAKFGNKVMEDFGEIVSEKTVSAKSAEKGKTARKSVKRKVDVEEEPGSSKKAKVDESQSARKYKLRNQKVLWGRIFAPDILELAGMRQLVEICEFQQ